MLTNSLPRKWLFLTTSSTSRQPWGNCLPRNTTQFLSSPPVLHSLSLPRWGLSRHSLWLLHSQSTLPSSQGSLTPMVVLTPISSLNSFLSESLLSLQVSKVPREESPTSTLSTSPFIPPSPSRLPEMLHSGLYSTWILTPHQRNILHAPQRRPTLGSSRACVPHSPLCWLAFCQLDTGWIRLRDGNLN